MPQAAVEAPGVRLPVNGGNGLVLFVQNVWHEQLGVGHLSAVLRRAGFETRVEVWGDEKQLRQVLSECDPLFVGVPVISGSHGWAEGVAARLKAVRPDLPVILGGPHPTFYPKAALHPNVDAAVRGEAEGAVLEIAFAFMNGGDVAALRNIPNLVVRDEDGALKVNPLRSLYPDLDEIGKPDREIYARHPYFRTETLYPVITTRGCPYSCSYCFNAHYRELYAGNGKSIRVRNVEDVLAECRELRDRHGATCINFVDDIFGLKREWAEEFLSRYRREVGVSFLCNTKSDLFTEDMARGLAEAGCHVLQFGLESAGEDVRKTLKRTEKDHHLDNLSRLAKKYQLNLRAYFMIGVPGQGVEGSLATIHLARNMGVRYPFVSIFQPYPGTKLGDLLRQSGVVDEQGYLEGLHQSALRGSVVRDKERMALENLQKFSFLLVFFPWLEGPARHLCRLPPNKLFELIYLCSFWYTQARLTRRSLAKTLHYGIKNIRFFYDRTNKAGLPAGP